MSTGLQRVPPPVCPILAGLRRLEEDARNGVAGAAQQIHEIEKRCRKIRLGLPAKVTKKSCKPTTPTNALALTLLRIVHLIKNYGRGSGQLDKEIGKLKPLTRNSFPDWWRCAWLVTKNENFCDDEMKSLMEQISANAPMVQTVMTARAEKMLLIYQEMKSKAAGTTWENFPGLEKKAKRQYTVAENAHFAYVRRQTKAAARREWFA